MVTTARMIAVEHGLSDKYVDRVDPNLNCPGFQLWHVTIAGAGDFLFTADAPESVATRAYLRARVPEDDVTVNHHMGPNPDRDTWDRLNRGDR